jgi:hypothetical protein
VRNRFHAGENPTGFFAALRMTEIRRFIFIAYQTRWRWSEVIGMTDEIMNEATMENSC